MHVAGTVQDASLGTPPAIVVEFPSWCKFNPDGVLGDTFNSLRTTWDNFATTKLDNRTCDVKGFLRIFCEHCTGGGSGGSNPNHAYEFHPALSMTCGNQDFDFGNMLRAFPGLRHISPSTANNCIQGRTLDVRFKNNRYEFFESGGGSCGNFAIVRIRSIDLDWSFAKDSATSWESARSLSKIRDSAAMLEITDKLVDHFSGQLSKGAFVNVRKTLASAKNAKQAKQKSAMSEAAKQLREAQRRIQSWPKVKHTVALSKGLRRVFKQGRDKFTVAYDDPSIASFHEWRKQVKHLLYQSRVLTPLWHNTMKTLSGELKTLGKYLSEDHDLGILRDLVAEQLDDANDRTEIEAFIALIDQRRNELQEEARVLGLRIYADKPRAFASRAEAYWRAWRAEIKHDPIRVG